MGSRGPRGEHQSGLIRVSKRGKENRKFQFVISPITSNMVDVSVLVQLTDRVASLSQADGFEKELSGIVFFPIITDPARFPREDFTVNKRSDRAYYVGKNIDFRSWRQARGPGRLRMALDNFVASVMAIPDSKFSRDAKKRLVGNIQKAFHSIKSSHK